MKTQIHINHINEIEKYRSFPFVVEVAAFTDCGTTERWGTNTEKEARKILADESAACEKWASAEVDEYNPKTNEIPAVAQILVRPNPDEDGDIEYLTYWKTL